MMATRSVGLERHGGIRIRTGNTSYPTRTRATKSLICATTPAKRPRWHVHLTPTSSSWLNQIERFFALLTERQIRRGVHRSVEELEAAINAFLDHNNANPRPFRWIKSADDILAAVERFCAYNTSSI